jgi:hypothetical protein
MKVKFFCTPRSMDLYLLFSVSVKILLWLYIFKYYKIVYYFIKFILLHVLFSIFSHFYTIVIHEATVGLVD